MLISIHCLDKPGALELRMQTRPAHLEWVKKTLPNGTVFAGPMFADDGKTFIGSLFVVEFETLDAARAWNQQDPYVKAGLFGQIITAPCRNLAPETLAGR